MLGQWNHVVMSIDLSNSNAKLFYNGIEDTAATNTEYLSGQTIDWSAATDWEIGKTSSQYFD